jgi:hypothetical protein
MVLDARTPRSIAARVRSASESANSAPLRARDLLDELSGGTGRKRRRTPKD